MIAAYRDAGGRGTGLPAGAPELGADRGRGRGDRVRPVAQQHLRAAGVLGPGDRRALRRGLRGRHARAGRQVGATSRADLGRHVELAAASTRSWASTRSTCTTSGRSRASSSTRSARRCCRNCAPPGDHPGPVVPLGCYSMEALFEVVVFLAIATFGAALARRLGLLAPILLVVLGLGLSFVPGFRRPSSIPTWCWSASCRRCSTWPRWRPRCRRSGSTCGRSCCSRSGWCCSPRSRSASGAPVPARPAVRHLRGAGRGGGAAGRGRRDRGGPPDRAAPPGGHHPGGREPDQRRDRAGAAAGRDRRGAPAAPVGGSDVARSGGRRRRRGADRVAVGASCSPRCTSGSRPAAGQRGVAARAVRWSSPAERIHASGVVAVVVTGLCLGHRMPHAAVGRLPAADGSVLADGQFLLEGVGVPAGRAAAAPSAPGSTSRPGAGGGHRRGGRRVIVTRLVWVFPATYLARLVPRSAPRDPAAAGACRP